MSDLSIGETLLAIGILVSPFFCCAIQQDQINDDIQRKRNKRKSDEEQRTLYLRKHKLFSTHIQKYTYTNLSEDLYADYIVDEKQEKILVSDSADDYVIIPFDEITGCEIMINNSVSGGIGRAIAGGILAGGAGAIVGAVTNKRIDTYQVVIYRNNLQYPKFVFHLIKKSDNLQIQINMDRERADVFARDVNASIKAIISQRNTQQEVVAECSQDVSIRLKKLDKLKENSLISEKEYKSKRQKILDDL